MATSANEDRLLDLLVRWDELRRQGRDVSAAELFAGLPAELGGELGKGIGSSFAGIDPVLDFAGTEVLPNIKNPGSRHAQGRKVPDVMHTFGNLSAAATPRRKADWAKCLPPDKRS